MIKKLRWIETLNTYPYKNLAMEEYMTTHNVDEECILFLWQNRRTVVIGKNQNCWKECRVNALETDGGYLVRRLSGGGAVYHDLGNLNFTFMVKQADYDVNRQLQVIITALSLLGVHSQQTGRNDITVDGRKFSGNAFFRKGDFRFHHGTLLLDVDTEQMARYLNVSAEKLSSKSVSSVKSRVVNLKELCPGLTVEILKEKLVEAFSQVYGMEAVELTEASFPSYEIQRLTERFESWDWKYGRKIPFEYSVESRFDWGEVQLQFHVNQGLILDVVVYSDSMELELIEKISDVLIGKHYNAESLCETLDELCEALKQKNFRASASDVLNLGTSSLQAIITDLKSLIRDSM